MSDIDVYDNSQLVFSSVAKPFVAHTFFKLSDHAYRNGFATLAAKLEEKMVAETGLRNGAHDEAGHDAVIDAKRKQSQKEIERYRLQSAFENLSLKDKMILNMILKHRKTKGDSSKPKNRKCVETIVEEGSENEDDAEMDESPAQDPLLLTETKLKQFDAASGHSNSQNPSANDSDELSSVVISETDRESLDIAMRLMNDGVRYLCFISCSMHFFQMTNKLCRHSIF